MFFNLESQIVDGLPKVECSPMTVLGGVLGVPLFREFCVIVKKFTNHPTNRDNCVRWKTFRTPRTGLARDTGRRQASGCDVIAGCA